MATADEVTLAATDNVPMDLGLSERQTAGGLEGSRRIEQHNRYRGRSMAVFTVCLLFL
jgi:hypothetical protein